MAYNKKPSITCRKSLASVLNTYVVYLCKLYIVHSVCELAEFDPPVSAPTGPSYPSHPQMTPSR